MANITRSAVFLELVLAKMFALCDSMVFWLKNIFSDITGEVKPWQIN
jgi:hypothetical protein